MRDRKIRLRVCADLRGYVTVTVPQDEFEELFALAAEGDLEQFDRALIASVESLVLDNPRRLELECEIMDHDFPDGEQAPSSEGAAE